MLAFLKTHPFAVESHFDSSLVLTFAIPKEELQGHIPSFLDLDTFQGKWAFIAVAMVQTKGLRPKGFPKLLGNDFFLIGYRIFVKYIDKNGKRLRGLFILKSETDKKKMEFLGNIFTHYKYSTVDIQQKYGEGKIAIKSEKANFSIEVSTANEQVKFPAGSPFSDWKEARRFAGPLPFSFSYDRNAKKIFIVQGVRQNWQPKAVEVLHHKISFIDDLNLKDVRLANAFIIRDIPYYWKKAKVEKWIQ